MITRVVIGTCDDAQLALMIEQITRNISGVLHHQVFFACLIIEKIQIEKRCVDIEYAKIDLLVVLGIIRHIIAVAIAAGQYRRGLARIHIGGIKAIVLIPHIVHKQQHRFAIGCPRGIWHAVHFVRPFDRGLLPRLPVQHHIAVLIVGHMPVENQTTVRRYLRRGIFSITHEHIKRNQITYIVVVGQRGQLPAFAFRPIKIPAELTARQQSDC